MQTKAADSASKPAEPTWLRDTQARIARIADALADDDQELAFRLLEDLETDLAAATA